jgi:hypothetical protein
MNLLDHGHDAVSALRRLATMGKEDIEVIQPRTDALLDQNSQPAKVRMCQQYCLIIQERHGKGGNTQS